MQVVQYTSAHFRVVSQVELRSGYYVFCCLIFVLFVHNKNKLYLKSQLNFDAILKVIKDRYDLKKSPEIVGNSNRKNAQLYFLAEPEKRQVAIFLCQKRTFQIKYLTLLSVLIALAAPRFLEMDRL